VSALTVTLERAFNHLRRLLGDPVIYALPGSGSPAYYEIPVLWSSSAVNVLLPPVQLAEIGELVAVTTSDYQDQLLNCLVQLDYPDGDHYAIRHLDNSPGGQPGFIVLYLARVDVAYQGT
jgi:hypothetical protein